MTCEKCWSDANGRALLQGGSVSDHYQNLIAERRDHPCSPKEQAGQWWDEATQRDTRSQRWPFRD